MSAGAAAAEEEEEEDEDDEDDDEDEDAEYVEEARLAAAGRRNEAFQSGFSTANARAALVSATNDGPARRNSQQHKRKKNKKKTKKKRCARAYACFRNFNCVRE